MMNAFLDDEVEDKDLSQVESHLADCPDCSNEARAWETCTDSLRTTFPDQEPPSDLWEKIHAKADVKE
jgi:anti-sigma factor RsiW